MYLVTPFNQFYAASDFYPVATTTDNNAEHGGCNVFCAHDTHGAAAQQCSCTPHEQLDCMLSYAQRNPLPTPSYTTLLEAAHKANEDHKADPHADNAI